MGTLEIELLIGPATFVAVFQVLRIPTSFNLLLGRPWIHRAGAIPFPFIRRDGGFLSRLCSHVLRPAQQHGGARYYAKHVLSSRYGWGGVSTSLGEGEGSLDSYALLLSYSPIHLSLADYFVRASEPHAPSDGIIGGLSTTQEAELQHLVSSYS
ncbi:hypothetical protein CK203_094284 [Vitis vinifera]|uniref:Uncharacterized protein n=1 Tax=Vitis vinifera TaxID=29760 RepID=A0A438DZF2_VITVI|nr:hypothetical protein CK203_094284 [Vitis vinifera]